MISSKSMRFFLIAVYPLFLITGCARINSSSENLAYQNLKVFIDSINVVDTHEHQRMLTISSQEEVNFYNILNMTYLKSDLRSAGAPRMDSDLIASGDLDSLWKAYGVYLDRCRNTSFYGHLVQGFRILYNMEEPYFTKENIEKLSGQLARNYKNPNHWYNAAFRKAPFELMINSQWRDFFKIQTGFEGYALVLRFDMYVTSVSQRTALDHPEADTLGNPYYKARQEGTEIRNLDDYLDFADRWFAKIVESGAVCAKTLNAYLRSIDYSDVSRQEADRLFARPSESLTSEDIKRLEDFMFFWCVRKFAEYDLPVQIHTGQLGGLYRNLDNGHPMKLLDVFQGCPQTKFSLLHGGFPWYQDIGSIAKSYPNVYVDLVWLPQISREAAVNALHQWLDCVPYTKFFWGGDCVTIEEAVGALEYGRDVVAQVLAERVSSGRMTDDFAMEIARAIFRDNAIRFYKLCE